MNDIASSSSTPASPVDTPPSVPSPTIAKVTLKDVSEEDKTSAARLKAEANEAFKSASPSLLKFYPVR